MKILVTGGRGFIGSHLITALRDKGHTVYSFDKKDGQDICNRTSLTHSVKFVDAVYHLAALTNVQESFIDPLKYYQTNLVGTLNVLHACKHKKLIYTSTAASYDPLSSPYAHSKTLAEQVISYIHPKAVIFRLFNVYGKGMNKTTMISRFQKENPIIIYGTGKQTRDFIHIDDVVSILVSALSTKWNGFCGDVGTGESHTVSSIAKLYKKPIVYKAKRHEVYRSQANIKELKKLYKKPFKKLQDTL